MNRTRCQVPKQGLLLLTAALLSGCAGPSTRVLPQRQGGTMQEVPDEIPVVEEVNSFYLQESLSILSASARPARKPGGGQCCPLYTEAFKGLRLCGKPSALPPEDGACGDHRHQCDGGAPGGGSGCGYSAGLYLA